jgi:hypothetical protein
VLDSYSASSLKQQTACRYVAPIGQIILIPSHPVFALSRYAVCLAEKQQIPIFLVFGFNRSVLEPTIYHTQGEHANHYATEAVNITIDVAIVNVKVITSVINKNELEIGMKHFCVWIEIKYDINS